MAKVDRTAAAHALIERIVQMRTEVETQTSLDPHMGRRHHKAVFELGELKLTSAHLLLMSTMNEFHRAVADGEGRDVEAARKACLWAIDRALSALHAIAS